MHPGCLRHDLSVRCVDHSEKQKKRGIHPSICPWNWPWRLLLFSRNSGGKKQEKVGYMKLNAFAIVKFPVFVWLNRWILPLHLVPPSFSSAFLLIFSFHPTKGHIGCLLGFQTQLDIVRRWCQGLFRPQFRASPAYSAQLQRSSNTKQATYYYASLSVQV